MTTLVHKVDDQWVPLSGPTVELVRMETTGSLSRGDGTVETVEVKPYAIRETASVARLYAMVAAGEWTTEDLEPRGVRIAVPFEVPEGFVRVGEPSYEEQDGQVFEFYDMDSALQPEKEAPKPEPEPEDASLTVTEKLAAVGLTEDELVEHLAKLGFTRSER